MAIPQPGHQRWLVRCVVATFLPLATGIVAPAQDTSPYSQCVRSDQALPFTAAPQPWIVVSQLSPAPPPTFRAGPPIMMSQDPYAPVYQQPFADGMLGFIDPSFGTGILNAPPSGNRMPPLKARSVINARRDLGS